jgi:hypothetical protein
MRRPGGVDRILVSTAEGANPVIGDVLQYKVTTCARAIAADDANAAFYLPGSVYPFSLPV